MNTFCMTVFPLNCISLFLEIRQFYSIWNWNATKFPQIQNIYIFLLSCIWLLLNGPPWMPCCLSICQTSCFSAQFGELHVWLRRKMTIEKTSWHSGKSILLLNYFFFLLQTCSNSNRCKHNTSICHKTRVTFRIFILNHYLMVYVSLMCRILLNEPSVCEKHFDQHCYSSFQNAYFIYNFFPLLGLSPSIYWPIEN